MTPKTDGNWTATQLILGATRLPELRIWALLLAGTATALLTLQSAPLSLPLASALSGAGALLWVILEYVLHRWLLHMHVPTRPRMKRVHRRLHWQHHQDPTDLTKLTVPLWGTVVLHLVAMGVGYSLAGAAGVLPTLLGFSAAFGAYELAHFAAHVPYRPRTPWGRAMKRRHSWHHYKNEGYWFGVTHPLLDQLFQTSPAQADVPRSPTARQLGGTEPPGD